MKTKIFLIVFFVPALCWGQKYDGICHAVTKLGITIRDMRFTEYAYNTFVESKYSNIGEVTNASPEELLKSQFSVKNNEWLSLNYGKPMSWSSAQFKKLNSPDNKVELLCKLNLKLDTMEFSIVKVNLHDNSKKLTPISLLMQKSSNGKWFIADNDLFSNLKFIFMFVSADDLCCLFNNKQASGNEKMNELIKLSWESKGLNLAQAINGLGGLLINSEYKTEATFRSVKNNVSATTNVPTESMLSYTNQKFCYFFENENTSFSDEATNKLLSLIKNQYPATAIFPLICYSYNDIKGQNIAYFKYQLAKEESTTIETSVFMSKSGRFEKALGNKKTDDIFSQSTEIIKSFFGIND